MHTRTMEHRFTWRQCQPLTFRKKFGYSTVEKMHAPGVEDTPPIKSGQHKKTEFDSLTE